MKTPAIILILCPLLTFGQKIISSKGSVKFFSDALIEDITATTSDATGIIDLSKSQFAFSVPIKEFKFEKSLMKQHFNEKYMETEKFPKATFLGRIENFNASTESQEIMAVGKMTIHGVTREVQIPATMKKIQSNYEVDSKFTVKLEDYNITIPQLLYQNIAESV
jgi:polyisoprenoid-binding protein YceI